MDTTSKVYNYIYDYIKEHNYAPTVREIKDGINCKSTQTVQRNMQILFENGYLETEAPKHSSRAYRLSKKVNKGENIKCQLLK